MPGRDMAAELAGREDRPWPGRSTAITVKSRASKGNNLPQRAQLSTSMPKTRFSRCAPLIATCRSIVDFSG